MAYSTNAQVASEFKSIAFSGTTSVTTTEIDRFITEADEVINSRIGLKYSLTDDITLALNPLSFPILRQISIWLVADRVREIMQVKDIGDDRIKQGARAPNSAARADKMLNQIVDGTLLLRDVDLNTTHDGFKSFATDEGLEHQFKKNVDQW